MRIKIKNRDNLTKIFKAIAWLDSRRWNNEKNYNFVHFFRDDLTNCEKILTHWICYITDRQMPFEIVWDRGGYIFSELVYEYSKGKLSPQKILNKYYEKYQDKGREKFRFKSKSKDNFTFASRYITDDYQNILQTLEILDYPKYKRNIILYIVKILQRFQKEEDLLIRIACALHLLTYQLDRKKANPEKIIKILNHDKAFEEKLKEFKKTSTNGKKRLWCCVRDYKKGLYHEIFKGAIREVAGGNAGKLIERWINLPMNQIELPGDVWNNSPLFRDNLFVNVVDMNSIPKNWRMPEIIRELYNQLKNNEDIDDFYPEQFDITFDFVPRMCNKKLCNVCLFGKNGVEKICIPTKDKYCPVALLSCGYIAKCVGNQGKCILKDGISKRICKGGLR